MDELERYRAALNEVDEQIITLLGQRYAICRDVARYKKQHNIPVVLHDRVNEVKARCAELAAGHHIDPDFIRNLYSLIIAEACRMEDKVINDPDIPDDHS